jgi:outer membrane lipoprotein-sorting protein
MKLKPLFAFIFVFIFVFSSGAFAQSPDKILKQAEKALGGAKNLRAVKSMRKTGTIVLIKDGASGRFVEQISLPNFYNTSYDLGGFETETGYNGKSGWRRDSREGLQTLTGNLSRDFSVEADFRNTLWLDYKKDKSKIAAGGRADVNGRAANIVRLTTANGVSMKLYFDAANGLPVREEIPAGDAMKVYDYDNYRVVGAVKVPFSIGFRDGENAYQIKLDDAKINEPISAAAFDFPNLSAAALPDIPQLLQSLQTKTDEIEDVLDTYSFNQKIIRRELGKDGVLRETESQTRQLSFYKGFRIARLIEKNGKPLSEKEQKNEDEEVQKRVAGIEKRIAKKEAKAAAQSTTAETDEENRRVSIAELLRASLLKNPRRERFRGRDVVVFDFEPNPNFDYKNAKSFLKFFGKTAGVMWIDAEDKQVARIEAVLADSFNIGGGVLAKLRKGASFTLEQERVGDEIWLPSLADINLSVRVMLVKGVDLNQVVKSYGYRKFSTEVKDAKIDEMKNP